MSAKKVIRTDSSEPETPKSGGWRKLFRQPVVIIGLVALGCFPWIRGMAAKSDAQLASQARYQVQRDEIRLPNSPEYVPVDLLNRTWQRAEIAEQFSILEPGLAEKLGHAFEQSPWVRRVKRLELRHPTTVEIELEYRRPVALVRTSEGYYPVDRDGVLLPPTDFSSAQLSQYPIVDNVSTVPESAAGTHWGDLAVWGGARLVDLLAPAGDMEPYWKAYGLKSVRVYGQADLANGSPADLKQISYRLITTNGSEIVWGLAPGVSDPTEPDAETKLKRLGIYFRDFGGINSQRGPVEIDLRRWKDIARRPLQLPDGNAVR